VNVLIPIILFFCLNVRHVCERRLCHRHFSVNVRFRFGFFMVTLALHFFVRGQCRRIGLPFYGRAPLFVFLVGLVLWYSNFVESMNSLSSSSDPMSLKYSLSSTMMHLSASVASSFLFLDVFPRNLVNPYFFVYWKFEATMLAMTS
jgi:hypothetical protein